MYTKLYQGLCLKIFSSLPCCDSVEMVADYNVLDNVLVWCLDFKIYMVSSLAGPSFLALFF